MIEHSLPHQIVIIMVPIGLIQVSHQLTLPIIGLINQISAARAIDLIEYKRGLCLIHNLLTQPLVPPNPVAIADCVAPQI